ncbi:MAG TPA: NAD(P)-dependent oxidoreductase [Chloroflexota bacterium]|nr:NAD(P)-dependent oxidoreductase [Chloroflexota bacterium]
MRVVVTGGSGRLGRVVVRDHLAAGHDVLSLDRVPCADAPCPTWVADLTRAGDVYQALAGKDAVVHLAAYQRPGLAPDTETFGNNVQATYNVLKAAVDLSVRSVVVASSIAAYGYLYAARPSMPEYLPLDERHPCAPQDPYGLSKVVGERLGHAFADLGVASVVSLRFAGVNFDPSFATFPARWTSPRGPRGYWTYVDARDAARACRLALEVAPPGHHVLNVAAPLSSMPEPTEVLVRRHLPELLGALRAPAGVSHWSGLNCAEAEHVLGFRAEHLWSDYLGSNGTPRR